eukprot:239826_1
MERRHHPLMDHYSSSRNTVPIGDGAVFLTDTMDDEQIENTKRFLYQHRKWNHIMASSPTSFDAVSDCLIDKIDDPWSLHLNLPFTYLNRNVDNLKCLRYLHLKCLQLDLSTSNPLWASAFDHLSQNRNITTSLHKLQLPRYLFTQELISKNKATCNAFHALMNGKLLSLTTICIEMDDDLLPNEQQYVNDFMFINSLNFKHPIYKTLHLYCIDRLRVFECPFDIFMVLVYGLFCNQFPFLQRRVKKRYTNDELFLIRSLKHPLSIDTLTIYPPVLKKEMLLFVHALQCKNMPALMTLKFQNWSIGQLASFCRAIQRLTVIEYEHKWKQKQKRKHHKQRSNPYPFNKHKRSKSHHRRASAVDLNKIIADSQGLDFRIEILKQKPLFHHIHSFIMNISTSSLFADLLSDFDKKDAYKKCTKHKIKAVPKLYMESKNGSSKLYTADHVLHNKSLKWLLRMGHIIRYQFSHLNVFGLNNYSFLFSSKCFMVQLLNGIAFHKYCRQIDLEGIGTEKYHAIQADDLAQVVIKSGQIAQKHYVFVDGRLEKVLPPKDVRIVMMKYIYGEAYCNKGTGILSIDMSANKGAARRHSIWSALQTIKRRNDIKRIDTKLDDFELVLKALDNNWALSGLSHSNEYWEWKKETKKIQNRRKMIHFSAM